MRFASRMGNRYGGWGEHWDGQVVLTAPLSFHHFCKAVCSPFFLQSSIFRRLRKTGSSRDKDRRREAKRGQSNWKHISDTCLQFDSHSSTEAFKMWVFFPDHQPLNWSIVVFSSLLNTPHNLPFTKEAGLHELVSNIDTVQKINYFSFSSSRSLSCVPLCTEHVKWCQKSVFWQSRAKLVKKKTWKGI